MADLYEPMSEEERKTYLNRLASSLGLRTSGGYYFDPRAQLIDPYIQEFVAYGDAPNADALFAEFAPNFTYNKEVALSGGRTLDSTLANYLVDNPEATPGELQTVVDALFVKSTVVNPDGTTSEVIPAEDYFNLDQDQKYVAYDAARTIFNEYSSARRKVAEETQKWSENAPWTKLGLPLPDAEYDLTKFEPYVAKRKELETRFREEYNKKYGADNKSVDTAAKNYFDSLDKTVNQRLRESGRSPFYDAIIRREAIKYATP